MISGVVENLQPKIRLQLIGRNGRRKQIEALVDSGYNASLALPSKLIASLGLTWVSDAKGRLADGSECKYNIFHATVFWDRKPIRVLVDELDGHPLVGMELLDGYELKVQVRTKGKVTIKRLR